MNHSKKIHPKEFIKLLKLNTTETHKAYVKAQKNYLSVLKKFIKQEIASGSDYKERYDDQAVVCLENQFLPYWAFFQDLNNEIKVLDGIIDNYEFELLNPEEFEEELN